MKDYLKELYGSYIEEVAKPICKKSFKTGKIENNDWNPKTFGFFWRKGKEYFGNLGLDEVDYEIRFRRDFLREIDPSLYIAYEKRFKEEVSEWFPGEYLVDLCWRRWDDDWYRAELAMEVEWDPLAPDYDYGPQIGIEPVDEDIYKLLDVRARFKVGILGCKKSSETYLTTSQAKTVIDRLSRWIKKTGSTNESYLIIFRDRYKGGGLRGYLVQGDGHSETLSDCSYEELWED